MLDMDRNILLEILKEENYPSHMIENTLHKLSNLQPQTATALEKWLKDGKTPSLNVEGYTFSILTTKFGMQPIGAFLTLDWLCREPQKASDALKRGIR